MEDLRNLILARVRQVGVERVARSLVVSPGQLAVIRASHQAQPSPVLQELLDHIAQNFKQSAG